ncbi:uncharacterized protein LOC121245660, partial [Juglans microcarpa x Juglans regia]|uniref:uncharacterized protein LOC121245660 n=1 Tax=Juglans microcarpa x Juglans regia TaxID=2249226 RepID=UPI001B7F21A8
MILQIQNFSELVHKAMLANRILRGVLNYKNRGRELLHKDFLVRIKGNGKREMRGAVQVRGRYREILHLTLVSSVTAYTMESAGRKWVHVSNAVRMGISLENVHCCGDNRRPNPPQNFRPINQGNNQRRTVPARVFALTPGEAEDKEDVITGIVPLFLNKAIVLFDSGATHSFISMDYVKLCPIVADEMDYNLRVSTPTGDIVTCNKILLKCPITISGKEMPANLI